MIRSTLRTVLAIGALWLLAARLVANDEAVTAAEHGRQGASGAVDNAARDALAKFGQGDPGWKIRMEALVSLMRAGPEVVPVLVEALKNGSPPTREFAAHALAFIADPGTRPDLEQALSDDETAVRMYAINALSMFGRLEPTEQHQYILQNDNWLIRRHMVFALERDDTPNPVALRNALAGYHLAQMDTARLGQVAPDFSLTDVLGQNYQLARFRGKQPVVLLFLTIA